VKIESTAKRIAHNLNHLGDKTAVIIDGQEFSYSDLKVRVCPLINKIETMGSIGQTIGLQLSNSIECYASLIALLISGRVFVPLNEGFGIEQNDYIIKTAEINCIIETENNTFVSDFKEKGIEIIECTKLEDGIIRYSESKFVYTLFTSGSTGRPKGVPITHSNLDHFIQSIVQDSDWSLDSNDRFLQPFNLSFDLYVFTVYLPLYLGATFLTVPLNKIALYSASLLAEESITVSLLVPSTMKIINKLSGNIIFEKLKYFSVFCSSNVTSQTGRVVKKMTHPLGRSTHNW